MAAAGSFVCPMLLVLPFYPAAPEAARFWMFEFHRLSIPTKLWHVRWQDALALMPAAWLALTAAITWHAVSGRKPVGREIVLAGAAVLAIAANLFPRGTFEEYTVTFLPSLAMAAIAICTPVIKCIPRTGTAARVMMLVMLNIIGGPLLLWRDMPASRANSPALLLPLNAPAYQPDLHGRIDTAHAVIRRYLPKTALFVGPQIILAAGTGNEVPRNLRLGAFTTTADFPHYSVRCAQLCPTWRPDDLFGSAKGA